MNTQDYYLLHPVASSIASEITHSDIDAIDRKLNVEQRVSALRSRVNTILEQHKTHGEAATTSEIRDWSLGEATGDIEEIERNLSLYPKHVTIRFIRNSLRRLGIEDTSLQTPLLWLAVSIAIEKPEILAAMERVFAKRIDSIQELAMSNEAQLKYQALVADKTLLPSVRDERIKQLALNSISDSMESIAPLLEFGTEERRDIARIRSALIDIPFVDMFRLAIEQGQFIEVKNMLLDNQSSASNLFTVVLTNQVEDYISKNVILKTAETESTRVKPMSTITNGATDDKKAPESETSDSKALLTVEETLQWLRISRSTLRRLEHNGTLIPIRINGSVRYSPESIRRYIGESM